ncbi:hypothetical protein SAMN05421853_1341 [Roseivivax halotolerans]|uniref:Uncharacterized protein n=1 Tax=Roseivivax halotolerans TaxID=93684 RepID=A0A1I6AQ90_9RHOB|nr:hypothetical protein [Roseivivax halotolerans]SFQ70779.1 hypothetical protein SAMN05421853_1341 [Roseivivax halotolerans]
MPETSAQPAPIWSMRPIFDSEARALPIRPLAASGEIMDMLHIHRASVGIQLGRPLTAEERPAGFRVDRSQDWRGIRRPRVDDASLERILASVDLYPFNSVVCVTQAVAEAMADLDFGNGRLTEVPVYREDGIRMPLPLYMMEYPNQKDTVLREITPRCKPLYRNNPAKQWKLPLRLTGRDVFVSARAVGGADFWLDPKISQCWFASDRAAQILTSLGLQESFQLNQCRLPGTAISF